MSTRSLSSRTLNTYIETLWYHPEYVTGHDYSIQMDYKLPDDRTYSWCVCFSEYFLSRKNNASCYNSTLWAEIKLFQYPMLSLISVIFNWPAFIPSLPNNSLMFLGTISPYFQQSDLTLGFMCGHEVQTWSIGIVHLLDHSDWFDSGMVMWFKLIQWYSTLGVYWTVEEEKLRNSVFTEVACLCKMNKLKPAGSTI